MKKSYAELTLIELVNLNQSFIKVLSDYRFDYYNDGNRRLSEVCIESGLEISLLESVLEKATHSPLDVQYDFQNMGLDSLIDHIEKVHHYYIRKNLPELSLMCNKIQFKEKISTLNGKVIELFIILLEELMLHMEDEENILFPHIRFLYNPLKYIKPEAGLTDQEGLTAYESMKTQHEEVGGILKQIRRLSDGYNFKKTDSDLIKSFFKKLHEFEEDLHLHIHLENNILFPQGLKLQNKL